MPKTTIKRITTKKFYKKESIMLRAEINEIKTNTTFEKISKTKS